MQDKCESTNDDCPAVRQLEKEVDRRFDEVKGSVSGLGKRVGDLESHNKVAG